jgi:hypothetical protein
VLEYTGQLTARLRAAEGQARKLRTEAEQLTQQRDAALRERDGLLRERSSRPAAPQEQVSARVTELLFTLDRDVERIKAEANVEADRILADARIEADRMRRDAELSRAEAARSLGDLSERREAMQDQLRRTCSDFLEVITSLAATLDDRDGAEPVVVPDMTEERSA